MFPSEGGARTRVRCNVMWWGLQGNILSPGKTSTSNLIGEDQADTVRRQVRSVQITVNNKYFGTNLGSGPSGDTNGSAVWRWGGKNCQQLMMMIWSLEPGQSGPDSMSADKLLQSMPSPCVRLSSKGHKSQSLQMFKFSLELRLLVKPEI